MTVGERQFHVVVKTKKTIGPDGSFSKQTLANATVK